MPNINIVIRNKIAREVDGKHIICGNSDYTAVFDFDAEWEKYDTKTARFIWGDKYADVIFSGNTCPFPVIVNAYGVLVGVYAGDLHTTTAAVIDTEKSILCKNGIPADPPPDVYAQIMDLLNNSGGGGKGNDGKSAYEIAVENGFTGTAAEWLESLVGSPGDPGKSAYEIAVENGFTGTAAEWLESLVGSPGDPGKSAYEIAVANGFTGTSAEWLESLKGQPGDAGKSAYEIAVANGFVGTEEEWLASLKGAPGDDYVLTEADKTEIAQAAADLVDSSLLGIIGEVS